MITIESKTYNQVWIDALERIRPELVHVNAEIHISVNSTSIRSGAKNILWLNEAYPLIQTIILDIENRPEYFAQYYSKVYTWNEITKKHSFMRHSHPSCSAWVDPVFLPQKEKNISLISSSKKIFYGHIYRLNLVEQLSKLKDIYGNKIDLYGKDTNYIPSKKDGLVPYRFSVAIENDARTNWYTEKILDCFLTCTVPIYYGSDTVFDKFNPNGIIKLDQNFDINNLTAETYNSMLDAIIENYYIAKKENVTPEETLKKIIIENSIL